MLIYAIISLGSGVAMIVGHNVWAGGLLPVAVTLVALVDFPEGLSATSAAARHAVSGVDGVGLHKPQGADYGNVALPDLALRMRCQPGQPCA